MRLNRKNKLLVLGFFVGLYLCYSFAISKTFQYKIQYQSNLEIEKGNYDNPRLLALLKSKENQIDKLLLENNSSYSNFQNELLKQISEYSDIHKLKIVDFKMPHQFTENNSTILSYMFSVEGGFNNAITVLNKIENSRNLGRIRHVSTQKKTNFKTNSEYLVTTVVIEKVNNIRN